MEHHVNLFALWWLPGEVARKDSMFDFDRHRSDPLHTLHIYIFITAFNISSMYSGQLSRSTTYLFLLCFLLLLLLRYTLQTARFFFVGSIIRSSGAWTQELGMWSQSEPRDGGEINAGVILARSTRSSFAGSLWLSLFILTTLVASMFLALGVRNQRSQPRQLQQPRPISQDFAARCLSQDCAAWSYSHEEADWK